jgi:hypothetical protein
LTKSNKSSGRVWRLGGADYNAALRIPVLLRRTVIMTQASNATERIVGVLAFVATFAAMRFLGLGTQVAILAGSLVGLLLVLPAYFIARRKGLAVFASRTLFGGAVVGAIGGLILALPLTIVLTIVAVRKPALPSQA